MKLFYFFVMQTPLEDSDCKEIKGEIEMEKATTTATTKSSNSWFPFSSLWRKNKKAVVEEENEAEEDNPKENHGDVATTIDLTVRNGNGNETLAAIKEEQEDEQR